ncbi:MAG: glycosyltransferase family 4 protein [Maribacter sp.]
MKIVHLTTVHPRRDTRIFYRECISLKNEGYDTYLLVADGLGNEKVEGVQVIDMGKEKSRIKNFFAGYRKIIDQVKQLQPKLVHLHDPELIVVGRKIQKMGIPVVFDIHENIAVQILDKQYIPKFLRSPISWVYKKIEQRCIKHLHLILAEHSYEEVYTARGKSLTIVLNMPDLEHFTPYQTLERHGNEIFYIGGISNERGLDVTLSALKLLKQRGVSFFMHYIGPISKEKLAALDLAEIEDAIKFYGRMDSKKGFEISKACRVGLSVLKPIKNYVGSYSTKIFEYMAIGLPVITSNFPLYQNVVEKYDCGFCIEPSSKEELADSIERLLREGTLGQRMGQNGIKAVTEQFNWSNEKEKLSSTYSSILKE